MRCGCRMPSLPIIVIGAGAAGLAAARVLADRGHHVTILEARARVGGRIHTVLDDARPVELGAEFIHGRPPATWDLLREADLRVCDVPFEHMERRAGRLISRPDYWTELRSGLRGLARIGPRDISVAEYLRRNRTLDAHARTMVEDFVSGFDAADLERISAKSIAREQEDVGDLRESQFRLLHGYAGLTQFLQQSLDKSRVRIRLRSPVAEIHWSKRGVACYVGRTRRVVRGRAAVITLPLGVLQLSPDNTGAVRFVPDIPEKQRAAMKLGSGPVLKVILRFVEPFWETDSFIRAARADRPLQNASFLHCYAAAFPTWWTPRPLRDPLLTGWAGGPKARALSGRSHEELIREALRSLAVLFRHPVARIASLLVRGRVHDWPSDAFARGAYSYVTVGGGRARAVLAQPVDGVLFFAGEATDTAGQASTVAGALQSGHRAARELFASSAHW